MLSDGTGRGLIEEMRRGPLGRYNVEEVNRVQREMAHIQRRVEELKGAAERGGVTEELSVNFALLKAQRERHARVLKAYGFSRLGKIARNYFAKEGIKELLSASELEFDAACGANLESFLAAYSHLDLAHRDPPLDLYVQILTLEDCGIIMDGDSFMELRRNRLYFLRRADVAHLIAQRAVRILE